MVRGSSTLTIFQFPIIGKMQYSPEHLKTMVYAKFGGQTEYIMGNWKIEN